VFTRRLNYYGILMAGMMKGNAVENIAASCLVDFLQKHFDPDYFKAHPQHKERLPAIVKIINSWGFSSIDDDLFDSEAFRAKVKTLTLEEYYGITGIEFTCTSVDLDDQTLRFFNHKTTPSLPVCKTVQMTGSFPVAFQAQRWQREWGKYFVHYDNFRREIDLTGHEFTDGGLLANFPIKYLDNEHMRPMYFSHRQNADRTILYGFGLDQVEDPQEDGKEKEIAKQLAIAELKDHLDGKFSKLKFIKNLILSDSSN
jgi:predicted acylesterase/phospholipase RssA